MRSALIPILFSGARNTPILDSISGVRAAYSMRLTRSAYSGPLVRIKDVTSGAVADFNADSKGQLDQNAVLGFLGGHSGYVDTWYDQSGNGRDLLTTGVANTTSPLFAANVRNGLPTVQFGNNGSVPFRYLQSVSFTNAQPWSFAIVYQRISVIQTSFENVFDSVSTDRGTLANSVGVATNAIYAGGLFNADNHQAVGSWGVVSGAFNSVSSSVHVDGNTAVTGNPGAITSDGITLGTQGGATPSGVRYSNMHVGEFFVFSGAISTAVDAQLHTALKATWRTP